MAKQCIGFLCLLISTLFISNNLLAQDPVFSQYYTNPVYANPAMTGLFKGDMRFSFNYRDQWSSVLGNDPFKTHAVAGELKLTTNGKDIIGIGADMLRDVSGSSNFNVTRAGVNLAVQKQLSGSRRSKSATYLGLGGRVGYGQHRINPGSVWMTSDYDSIRVEVRPGATNSLPPNFIGTTKGYLDITAGVNLSIVKRKYGFFAGLSAHHLNSPNVSFFFGKEEPLKTRLSAFMGGELQISDQLRLVPSSIVDYQGNSLRTTLGSALDYTSREHGDVSIRAGIYGRFVKSVTGSLYGESAIFVTKVEMKNISAGLSYDVNFGHIASATDNRGAFEISLGYIVTRSRKNKVVCPKL